MTTEESSKMNLKTKIIVFSSIFLVISLVHLFGVLFDDSLAFYTKPWLIISLMLLYISQVTQSNKTYLFALMFSLIGDILLMYPQQFFVLGLFSFLIAHFCFIAIIFKNLKEFKKVNMIKASLPFVLIFFMLMSLLYQNLNDLLISVIIYGLTISSFGALSFLHFLNTKSNANLWLFLGALFFIVSDSLLAINKFYAYHQLNGFLIMLTYIVAQFLIAKFMISLKSTQ